MTDWLRLFPDEDFRFRMGLRPGDAAAFFSPSQDGSLLARRVESLQTCPARYAAALPDSLPAIREAAEKMSRWSGLAMPPPASLDAGEWCRLAGTVYEPDWVLLSPDSEKNHPVVAGVVCFPSSWSLPEKLGLPVAQVHEPAPTVNTNLGRSIDTFLARVSADDPMERENWGLAADDALDHHPALCRSRLAAGTSLSATWLRLEHQLLIRLPGTRTVLFAIRVTVHRLDELAAIDGLAERLARALRTMPPEIAAYKGLEVCRHSLTERLENFRAPPASM